MSNWKFYLADSDDLTLNKDVTAISRDKSITLSHNRSGNAGFNIPLTAENLTLTHPNSKCLVAVKNGDIVWSGPIWSRTTDYNNSKIEISCVGWFEILMYRYITTSIPGPYTSTSESTIAFALLATANAHKDTYISAGNPGATTARTVTYEVFQNIGEEIIKLCDTESGFDFTVNPETRVMDITEDSVYTDNTDIPFGYGWGPDNIANINIEENGGELRNKIHVVGSDNNVYTAPSGVATTSITNYNMLEEVVQITEKDNATLLNAIANAELAVKENPITTYEITMKPYGVSNPYSFFDDYNIGDRIYVTANKRVDDGSIQLEAQPRIFSATISIDDGGREIVSSLRTTYTG